MTNTNYTDPTKLTDEEAEAHIGGLIRNFGSRPNKRNAYLLADAYKDQYRRWGRGSDFEQMQAWFAAEEGLGA